MSVKSISVGIATAPLVLIVVVGSWFWFGSDEAASDQPHIARNPAWVAPPPTWAPGAAYSTQHNQDMHVLWNELRQVEHWSDTDVTFLEYCLSDPPLFRGTDYSDADIAEIQKANRYMNAASIFAEHVQIGGTIDPASISGLKALLVERLSSPASAVRGYAVLAMVAVDGFGDPALMTALERMGDADPDVYVRSVTKVQFENAARRRDGRSR